MATYDPSKKYTWSKDDVFTLNGNEFGLILNSLRAVINTPEASVILLAAEASKGIEAVMARAVEANVAREMSDTPQQIKFEDFAKVTPADEPSMSIVHGEDND